MTYTSALYDAQNLRKAAAESASLCDLAQRLHVRSDLVKDALLRYDIPVPTHRNAEARRQSIERRRLAVSRQRYYHTRTAEGRRREKWTRSIARAMQEGREAKDIAQELGISAKMYRELAQSPYLRALQWAWGDIQLSESARYRLMQEMVEGGVSRATILRTLEMDPINYARKLGVEL